jgi:DNA-binding CsgD family transcriptional regulator/pimeloyl-ACP methyl ester carboxylesterase
MGPPAVQYVTTRDGYQIAYGLSGQGRPLVYLPGGFDHIHLAWKFPGLSGWLEALAARFQLIQFDPRGSGMSQRGLTSEHSSDAYQLDISTVVDHLNLAKFVLFGVGPSMRIATRYAFEHPERVSALICEAAGISARTMALFQSLPSQDWDWFLQSVAPRDLTPEEVRIRIDLSKQAYELPDFVLKMRASTPEGTGQHLEGLQIPTLVLHPRNYALLRPEQSTEVAQVSRGRMIFIEGSSMWGDPEQGVAAIETFLADVLHVPANEQSPVLGLSPREIEVLRLVAAGKSNQEIADQLVISRNTVRRHVSNCLDKIGAINRTQAVIYARDHGIV